MSDHRVTHGEYVTDDCPETGYSAKYAYRLGCRCETCVSENRRLTRVYHERNAARSAAQMEAAQRAAPSIRLCVRCEDGKPKSEFSTQRNRADGLAVVCRDCNAKYLREYRRKRKTG